MNLEFFIKLRDMMSGGLVKMASTAQKTTATIRAANGMLAQSYDTIRTKISQLENSIARSTSVSHIRTMRRELDQLNRMAARAPGNLAAGGGGFFSGMFRQVLPALGFAGAMAMGGSVIGAGLDAQARAKSFEVMAGKEQGGLLNQQLTKYAQDSIYGNEVYQNAQTMMGFGIAPEKVMGDMKMLGDIAMGNKDRMGRLALAYSQVAAAGKLMGQDLIQFVNAGFNPLKVISDKTGISFDTLRERMSEGAISFEHVKAAFESATGIGGKFYQMTEQIQQTAFGKWEAFKGQVQGLAMQIGLQLAPAFGNLISNYMAPFVGWLSESAKWIEANWHWIGMLAAVISTAVIAYHSYLGILKAVTFLTGLWAIAQNGLNVAMSLNPIGLVVAAIVALVAGIWWAWNHFEGFRKTILSTWEVLKVLWDYVGVVVKPIIGYWIFQLQILKMLFVALWEAVKWAFDKIKDYFLVVFGPIIEAIKWIWNKVAESDFGNKIAAAWNKGQMDEPAALSLAAITPGDANGGGGLSDIWANMKGNFGGAKDDGGMSRGIAGGGPRVINIHINKMVEKIDIVANSVDEGVDAIEKHVSEVLLRVLNSGAAIQ